MRKRYSIFVATNGNRGAYMAERDQRSDPLNLTDNAGVGNLKILIEPLVIGAICQPANSDGFP